MSRRGSAVLHSAEFGAGSTQRTICHSESPTQRKSGVVSPGRIHPSLRVREAATVSANPPCDPGGTDIPGTPTGRDPASVRGSAAHRSQEVAEDRWAPAPGRPPAAVPCISPTWPRCVYLSTNTHTGSDEIPQYSKSILLKNSALCTGKTVTFVGCLR